MNGCPDKSHSLMFMTSMSQVLQSIARDMHHLQQLYYDQDIDRSEVDFYSTMPAHDLLITVNSNIKREDALYNKYIMK